MIDISLDILLQIAKSDIDYSKSPEYFSQYYCPVKLKARSLLLSRSHHLPLSLRTAPCTVIFPSLLKLAI